MSLSYIVFNAVLIAYFLIETVKRILVSKLPLPQRGRAVDVAGYAQLTALLVGVIVLLWWSTGAY